MKTIAGALASHIAGEVLTLATCWKVTRRDAQIFGFTDYVSDLTVDGLSYRASTGYNATATDTSADLSVDNMEVEALLDSPTITEQDLYSGVWDFAQVEIFAVNYQSVTDGKLYIRKGMMGEVRIGRTRFVAELRGLAQYLQQSIGEVYTPSCRADFGDARCGFNKATVTVTGTLTSVTDRQTFADTARAEADDYFGGGLLTWTTGANVGRSMEVKSWTLSTRTFVLALPMVGTISIGDGYSVHAGCRKRMISDCQAKFNNVVNFRGEPYVPGIDASMRQP